MLESVSQKGFNQVVYVAAGLETLPYRSEELAGYKIIEVDLEGMIEYKKEIIERLKQENIIKVNNSVKYIAADLTDLLLLEELLKPDLSSGSTLFVLEGISYYIPKDFFKKLLDLLQKLPKKTAFIMDYWPENIKLDPSMKKTDERFSQDIEGYKGVFYSHEEVAALFEDYIKVNLAISEVEKLYCTDLLLQKRETSSNVNFMAAFSV